MGSTAQTIAHRVNDEVYQENGRWYGTFKKGKYMFPIDEEEQDRLDFFHTMFLTVRNEELISVSIHNQENPKVLDLGCGTGIWTIDMADKFPQGFHLGLDLSLIQPEYIPANTRFMQRDIEVSWQNDLEPGSWDLIHIGMMHGSISNSNWPRVYAEVARHLRPYYGVIEQIEIDWVLKSDDGSFSPNSVTAKLLDELLDAMDGFDRPMRLDSALTKQRMADAGLVDIKEEVVRLATNRWPATDPNSDLDPEAGRWFNIGLTHGIAGLCMAPLTRGHNRTVFEIKEMADQVKEELRSRKVHGYANVHIYTARKP
ncbi:S-adenosyl-L-methionine-dependent methyltransferase [Lasiosphaeria miniovina]|uniref:S-adenosyl-L-methionine-dependent methyltransferase n=1 Tax=Lasiosphaeria miniovina TaxID=1954250 RepID=A0AA40EA97_9PEZI|nr:S-adenosyl-L-methionine-dependent methyltransferase [Lasiosphaeria miniovina]KAK0734179.1 S-adenosyl-L-methionine-dependent methyltransferase [Lasiosphaeria miniovina]